MKLIFDLPEHEKNIVSQVIGSEEIRYSTPTDLSLDGRFSKGWFVITSSRAIWVDGGKVISDINISDGKDYKASALVGNGILEGVIDGEPRVLARYTMSHVPRYAFIARILNDLAKGNQPKVRSDDDDNTCPKCGKLLPQGTRICASCINKAAVVKRLWNVVKPYWPLIALAVTLFWLITVLQLLNPYLHRLFIDNFITRDYSLQEPEFSVFIKYLGAILGVSLLNVLFTVLRGRVMVTVGSKISLELRAMVYAKIQSLSMGYLSKRKTGDLMNRVTGDTNRLRTFIENQSVSGINMLFMLIGVTIVLFINNWKLAILVLLPSPIIVVVSTLLRHRIHVMYHNQWRVWDRANSLLQDILSGIRVVKAFGQEEKEINRFRGVSRAFANITKRNERAWNTLFPALGYFMGIGQYLVMYYGSKLVLGERMELGELVQFTQYVAILYGPLQWISFIPRWFTDAMTATERIFEILDEEPNVKDSKHPVHRKIEGRVVFKNVTFGYQSHEPVLEDINLEVEPGEMIGLVGHSGAGKSTLINLVLRFYDVDEGEIFIDGVNIRDIAQQSLRSQIGVVLQEPFLFSGSILDNIRYSKPDATPEEVMTAAKIANAHDFIIKFPDGYDTKVGENGYNLSGGERQRISIARAILHNPRILILDEATSSLDTEAEQLIQEALARLVRNRTTFAIAHRLSTLRNANRLVVIEKGRIAETGTHDELLRAKGIYYKLVMAQRQIYKVKTESV